MRWGEGRRMSELCGAVASVQIRKLPEIVRTMRASHGRIKAMLQDVPGIEFRRLNDPEGHTGPFLVVLLEAEEKAVKAAEKLRRYNACRLADYGLHVYHNIPALVHKVPLSPAGNPWSLRENAASDYSYAKGACPRTDALLARSVVVPIPSCLSAAQEEEIAGAIAASVRP